MKPSDSIVQTIPAVPALSGRDAASLCARMRDRWHTALSALSVRAGRAATVAAALLLGLLLCVPAPALAREGAPAAVPASSAQTAGTNAGAGTVANKPGVPAAGNISVQDAAALLKNAPPSLIILDVRTPGEFREGHIPGARNMDFFGGGFELQAASLPRDAVLLVYCRSGKRSAGAAEILDEAGIRHILHMNQGFEAWKDAGLPQER